MIVQIPIPQNYIGKWCIVEHFINNESSYDILWNNIVFESEDQAKKYLIERFKFQSFDVWQYYQVVQITDTYPVWQTYIREHETQI